MIQNKSFNFTDYQTETLSNQSITEHNGLQMSAYFTVPLAVYFICIVLFCILFNFILITIIISKESLHSVTNVFIINLGIADLVVAIIVILDAEFLIRGEYIHNELVCAIKESIFMFSLPAAVINLSLLTVERFFMIVFPFKHSKVFTTTNVTIILVFSWSYIFMVAIFPAIYYDDPAVVEHGKCYLMIPQFYIVFQFAFNFILPVLIIIVLNIVLLLVASFQESKIRKQCGYQIDCKKPSTIGQIPGIKAAKTIMLLVGVFLFCWISFIVLAITNINCNICHPRELTWIGSAVNYSVIACNPLLYGLKNKTIRKELMRKYILLFSKPYNNNDFQCHESAIPLNEYPAGMSLAKQDI